MSPLPATLKLYLRLVVDRRQAIARHMALRLGCGVLAALVLLVGLALLNAALFLALRPLLGDFWATLVDAVLHLGVGGGLAAFALSEPRSTELTALAEAETAALEALDTEAKERLLTLSNAEHRIAQIGSGLSLTAQMLPGLLGLLNRAPGPAAKPDAQPPKAEQPASNPTETSGPINESRQ